MEWIVQITKVLFEIIYDQVKKRQLQGSTLKTTFWEETNGELKKITRENYGVDRLKVKFNHLRFNIMNLQACYLVHELLGILNLIK